MRLRPGSLPWRVWHAVSFRWFLWKHRDLVRRLDAQMAEHQAKFGTWKEAGRWPDGTRDLQMERTLAWAEQQAASEGLDVWDARWCSECGALWRGEYCTECGLFAPCPHCGTRTELYGRCPACGDSIFDQEGA